MAVDLNRFQVRSALRVNFPLCPGDCFELFAPEIAGDTAKVAVASRLTAKFKPIAVPTLLRCPRKLPSQTPVTACVSRLRLPPGKL